MRREIIYKNTHHFSKKELSELFSAVNFNEAEFADKLAVSIRNFQTIFSAWDDDKLVGIVCVMDDGIMNAHIRYIIVRPDYQLKGIGKELLMRVQNHYHDYLSITAVCDDGLTKFFEYSGFEKIENTTLMYKGD